MRKTSFAIVLLLPTLLLSCIASIAEEHDPGALLTRPVFVDSQYLLLNDILRDISQQSGLAINHDQELRIETRFPFRDNLKAIDAVVRLLRGHNSVIEFSNDQKNINIHILAPPGSIN